MEKISEYDFECSVKRIKELEKEVLYLSKITKELKSGHDLLKDKINKLECYKPKDINEVF